MKWSFHAAKVWNRKRNANKKQNKKTRNHRIDVYLSIDCEKKNKNPLIDLSDTQKSLTQKSLTQNGKKQQNKSSETSVNE